MDMPANYARFPTGRDRSIQANRQLGFALAFGDLSTVPLAIVLVLLAVVPVVDDLRRAARAHGG